MKFCWVTINVKNMEDSVAFYRDIVGLTVKRRLKPTPGAEIVFLGSGDDAEIELIRRADVPHPWYGAGISLGFAVESLEAQMSFLKAKGIHDIGGPLAPDPSISFIYIEDPNGVRIQFLQYAAS
ncbi:MAG: VOC family protein [Spirochaetaceae bacterium]|nr:MAG: VOC family protein [Spirochaetaceae bacterium]